jgi:hypothetical protein
MYPVPRSTESLKSGLPEPNSKGVAGAGQNWTATGTCAVLRLNLIQKVRNKKRMNFVEVVHVSYAGPSGRAV